MKENELTDVVDFGKYLGTIWGHLPMDYLGWMVRVNHQHADKARRVAIVVSGHTDWNPDDPTGKYYDYDPIHDDDMEF